MSIYRRKSGRYAVLINLEVSAEGLRRRKSIGTYRTRKEAEAAERSALEAGDRGIDLSPAKLMIKELMTRFLKHCQTDDRTAATIETYGQKSKNSFFRGRSWSPPVVKGLFYKDFPDTSGCEKFSTVAIDGTRLATATIWCSGPPCTADASAGN